jgi:hypothetical protein
VRHQQANVEIAKLTCRQTGVETEPVHTRIDMDCDGFSTVRAPRDKLCLVVDHRDEIGSGQRVRGFRPNPLEYKNLGVREQLANHLSFEDLRDEIVAAAEPVEHTAGFLETDAVGAGFHHRTDRAIGSILEIAVVIGQRRAIDSKPCSHSLRSQMW